MAAAVLFVIAAVFFFLAAVGVAALPAPAAWGLFFTALGLALAHWKGRPGVLT